MSSSAAATAPLPPQDLDAEEYVLGAILLSPNAIDNVRGILDPGDFYRESNGRIYRAALSLHELGLPVDGITVAARLLELGQLEDVGGKERVHEIAAIAPAAANVAHHAALVAREATRRAYMLAGETLARRARESADPDELRAYALDLLQQQRAGTALPIEGLTHRQVLELELPADRVLVDDLVPAGAVGVIAAVPESHKSWLAQAIAVRVAAGNGTILGKQVVAQGPVGYFWQDDSTREEAERVKAFEQKHAQPADLPVLWFLNTGLHLPRDIPRIRATVEQNRLALIILDSYYNFLAGVDLKEAEAEQIVSQLKRDIADPTGCTVLIVDHMPWATEANRQRLRAYGGVFKNAATRFGIYIDAAGDKLHIEARGNNIHGIAKTLAYWDPDALELRLISRDDADPDDVKAPAPDIYEWVAEHGGEATTSEICFAFEISDKTIRAREPRLEQLGLEVIRQPGKPTRYRIADTTEKDEQLDLGTSEVPRKSDPLPGSACISDHGSDEDEAISATSEVTDLGTTSEVPTSEVKPHNHAGLREPRNTSEVETTSVDLQGFSTSEPRHSPTESAYAHAHARAREEHSDNGDPAIDDDEIERLAALAADTNGNGSSDDIDWSRTP